MSDQADVFFMQAQGMLLNLYSSINEQLIMQDGLAGARRRNEETLVLFENANEEMSETTKKGLDCVRVKLRGNEQGLETGELLINVAAGAILQITQQTLSMRYRKRTKAPEGRAVSCTCVRDLIWHGRNQAMHFEDTRLEPEKNANGKVNKGRDRSTWVETFQELQLQHPGRFVMKTPFQSLAKDVLDELGWTHDFSRLESDMQDLLKISVPT
jgi:hypothetical protein